MEKQPKGSSLTGFHILDTADEKGMFCARLLGDMGAAVTRVEPPGKPDNSPEYCYLNAGKRTIRLDTAKAGERDRFLDLVMRADALVDTGWLETLRLGYGELRKMNPGLVTASITGFGREGVSRNLKSSELVAQAAGGWLSVTGEPENPLKLYGNQAYYTASLFAANGIVLALLGRRITGQGQHLDISLQECVAATLDHALVRYVFQGETAVRTGGRYWNDAFRIFPCRDGHVLVSLNQHWETLVELLEAEGMAEDLAEAKWLDRQARAAGGDHIASVVEKWTLAHTAGDLVDLGQLMRFPWAAIAAPAEIAENPQHKARGYFEVLNCGETGRRYLAPGSPLRMMK